MAFDPNSIITAQARGNEKVVSFINGMNTRLAALQKRKNEQEAKLVKDIQAGQVDFLNEFAKQPKSSTVGFNLAAEQFVRDRAANQEILYRKAFGADGTAQDRANYNMQVMNDKRALSTIGEWMVLGNNTNKALTENAAAAEQDISLGAFTRGNDINKLSFQTKMSQSQFSNYDIQEDANGNIQLRGFANQQDYDNYKAGNTDALFESRNLTGDVQANKNGDAWYTQIGEDDLLSNKLGGIWNNQNPAIGLSKLFSKKTNERKHWDSDKQQWIYSQYEGYNTNQIKADLTGKYASRLNPLIKSPDFEKTWDQLYREGFLKDKDGKAYPEGETAWNTVRKVNLMSLDQFGKEFGDLTGDNKITQEDKDMYVNNMRDVAREGLANYFAEAIAPQGSQLIKSSVTDAKPGSDGTGRQPTPLTVDQQQKLNAYRPTYDRVLALDHKAAMEATDVAQLSKALTDELKSFEGSGVVLNKFANDRYADGITARKIIMATNPDDSEVRNIENNNTIYRLSFSSPGSGSQSPKAMYKPTPFINMQTLNQIAEMSPTDKIDVPGFGNINKEQYIERLLAQTLGVGHREWNHLSSTGKKKLP